MLNANGENRKDFQRERRGDKKVIPPPPSLFQYPVNLSILLTGGKRNQKRFA